MVGSGGLRLHVAKTVRVADGEVVEAALQRPRCARWETWSGDPSGRRSGHGSARCGCARRRRSAPECRLRGRSGPRATGTAARTRPRPARAAVRTGRSRPRARTRAARGERDRPVRTPSSGVSGSWLPGSSTSGRVQERRCSSPNSPFHHASSGSRLIEQIPGAEYGVHAAVLGEVENPSHHLQARPRQALLLLRAEARENASRDASRPCAEP